MDTAAQHTDMAEAYVKRWEPQEDFHDIPDHIIDTTNGISERELRHRVMIRRISHGSRSARGAAVTAQLTSIIQTLRMQRVNVLQGLQTILNPLQTTE